MIKRVKDIMTPSSKLVYLNPSDSIEFAFETMKKRKIQSVLVKSIGGTGVRIFEQDDLNDFWASGENSKKGKLGEYARPIEYSADPNWTIEVVKPHFKHAKHLIVYDERGNIIGLVSVSDLWKA